MHIIFHCETEIARVQSGQSKFIELHTDAPMRVAVDIRVPVKEYPEVWRLLFPIFHL